MDTYRSPVECGTSGALQGESESKSSRHFSSFIQWLEAILRDQNVPAEVRRAIDRVRTAAIRGGAAGIVVKGLHHALLAVASLLSQARGKKRRTVTLYEAAADTAVYTAFLACMGGVYTAVDEALALGLGKNRCVHAHPDAAVRPACNCPCAPWDGLRGPLGHDEGAYRASVEGARLGVVRMLYILMTI